MTNIIAWPHTSQFEVDRNPRYQQWLRNDHARELAYRQTIEDLAKTHPDAKNILDAGTGTGVWAIASAARFPFANVDGIDNCEKNIEQAQGAALLWPTLEGRLNFILEDINEYKPDQKYDIIITELDGGIGNNEGAYRAFASLQRMLTPNGVIVPEAIKHFSAPVSIPGLNNAIPKSNNSTFFKNRCDAINDPYACYYLVYGIEPEHLVGKPSGQHQIIPKDPSVRGASKQGFWSFDKIQDEALITGYLGWFWHKLTPNVQFTNHPGVTNLVCKPPHTITTWGQAYFPVHEFNVKPQDSIEFSLKECMTDLGPLPHYEWTVKHNGILRGEYSNEENQRRRV